MPNPATESLPHRPGRYEIRIRERIDDRWLAWFDEFTITRTESGETLLTGSVSDQSALHGLLAKTRDLNLTLVSVNQIEPTEKNNPRKMRNKHPMERSKGK